MATTPSPSRRPQISLLIHPRRTFPRSFSPSPPYLSPSPPPHTHHFPPGDTPHFTQAATATNHPQDISEKKDEMVMAVAAARRDAEAELNLPPGFRFHPTDEELVVHYLCARAAGRSAPVPIIAEVDLYRFDPWELPEMALFGTREWYFFTPRDRKYPNGSRPNRAAGSGYWKATGADKPVVHAGRTAGIKKALVFYHGKPPRGVKTDWIMHEYRLADAGRAAKKAGTLRLDDWVLCRLYNKKNEWEKIQQEKEAVSAVAMAASQSQSWGETRTPESEIDNDPFPELDSMPAFQDVGATNAILPKEELQELDSDWLMGINLDDLQGPGPLLPWDDSYASFLSPVAAKMEQDVSPFF